jgi:hypothetical protein
LCVLALARFLGSFVPSVLLENMFMCCATAWYMWVVMSAQNVRSAIERVMANSPAPFGVTVDLPYAGVHPDADCTDQCRLAEVGSESGPEVVIQVRPSVKGAGVKRKPMSNSIEEHGDDQDPDNEEQEKKPKSELLALASSLSVESRLTDVSVRKHRRTRLGLRWGIRHRFSSQWIR